MPRVIDLASEAQELYGVTLILGEGLCSNIYLIGKQNVTIIDTGVGNRVNAIWPQLEDLGIGPKNVKNVVLTHAHHDHAMGLLLLLERSDPLVYLHGKATRFIASRLGDRVVKVKDGDLINTDLWSMQVIWTPGHTEGSISLYSKEEKILFSGDTVFPGGNFGRFNGSSGSLKAIINSLKKLKELDVDVLLPGHGMPILKDANKHIEMAYNAAMLWG